MILSYLCIGVFAGFMAGLLGVGGGLIVVPALLFVFKQQGIISSDLVMHMALGTSLAAMIISSTTTVITHKKSGKTTEGIYEQIQVGIIVGTILGVGLAALLHSRVLEILFGILVFVSCIMMFMDYQPAPHRALPNRWILSATFLLIGLISGLLGIGGAAMSVPYLIYCNVPIRQVFYISSIISLTVALIGTIMFILTGIHVKNLPPYSTGYVYWPAVLGVGIISPLFAILGVKISYRLPVKILKKFFAVFLLLIGLQLVVG